ncbi:aldehyde dehydrogenase family protein [Oceanobacillus sp. CFH 90083]|uniref:aldehyde dehydrogenase family protein n=1 Tax=Oceanobacillus sp. CFH 90083 TaxID=2592336 RepID=UPI00128D84F2|nr:aldehyde dehydrogenase family protein [Oceanobacillus sp. CFH 90083]
MNDILLKNAYGLFIDGKWKVKNSKLLVLNKYSQEVIAEISIAEEQDVNASVAAAKKALNTSFSPYDRFRVLKKASELLLEQKEGLADVLVQEVGKPLTESIGEVERAALTLEISAEEAKRIHGEGVPIESAPGSENRKAMTIRTPVGVVAAITPFNVPLNLVCHKVGPGLAAGNSVILKPAEETSLSALLLAEIFEEAGLPAGRLNVLTGEGAEIGGYLTSNQEINMYTFTGSPRVGQIIRESTGIRKVALELGNNSATIVHRDAAIKESAVAAAQKSFNNAGQVCISVQRVFVHQDIYEAFLEEMIKAAKALKVGDPADASTNIGPMIAAKEAIRVENWVDEAISQGAQLQVGGKRDGVFYQPTILTNVDQEMKVCRNEVFGPVVAVDTYREEDEVIEKVNNSEYGLQAGLFTNDLSFAMKAAEKIEVGGLIINDTSGYRVDHMPYGGVKKSGTGKEGPKYAMEEMTEEKLIVFQS